MPTLPKWLEQLGRPKSFWGYLAIHAVLVAAASFFIYPLIGVLLIINGVKELRVVPLLSGLAMIGFFAAIPAWIEHRSVRKEWSGHKRAFMVLLFYLLLGLFLYSSAKSIRY